MILLKKINIEVNPNLEFINSILLTSKYNELTKPFIGYGLMTEESNQYTNAIREFFNIYQASTIYTTIEKMMPNGFTFSRPVELMLSLGNSKDFTIQYPLTDLCVQYCGGIENILFFLKQLYRFSKEINYFEFFETAKSYYNAYLPKIENHVKSYPFISMIESIYGKEQNSYNYVVSNLMVGNFGINFLNKETKSSDLFSVFNVCDVTDNPETNEFTNGALSVNILFHEFSHSFINPLTDKYFNIAEEYTSAYEHLKKYKLPDFRSGYGDWKECINEHFVRSMAIYLTLKCDRKEWADKHLENDLHRGYKYIPAILELYKYYECNRVKYRTFEDFYPTLLNVFKESV